MPDAGLTRAGAISGFPEWLPEVRLVEQAWIDTIRRCFERYGYTPIETASVESLDALLKKGETSKEVYTLQRLQADPDDRSDATLGLHFDLTVPFARYAAQHFNELVFPFKRYQIQKVWRGERPQEGRFREFVQCDIDVINPEQVPLHFDAEMPRVAHEVLTELGIGAVHASTSTTARCCRASTPGSASSDPLAVMRIDGQARQDRPGRRRARCSAELGLNAGQAQSCLELARDPRHGRLGRRRGPQARRAGRPAGGGPDRAGVRAGRAGRPADRRGAGEPVDRARPGLLHGHRLRDDVRRVPRASAASAPAGVTRTWPGRSSGAACPAWGSRSV